MGRSLDDVRKKHGLQSAPTSEPLDEEGYTVTREMLEAWGVGVDKVGGAAGRTIRSAKIAQRRYAEQDEIRDLMRKISLTDDELLRLQALGVRVDGKVESPEADLQAAEEQAMAARQRQYEKALAEQSPPPEAVNVPSAQQPEVVGALLQQNQQLMSQVAELTNQVIALTNQMRSVAPQANTGPKQIKRASNMSDEEKWRVMQSGDGLLG